MKVKEYLVNRILELESHIGELEEVKRSQLKELDSYEKVHQQLCDELDDYEMQREHIKQIITCNIGRNAYNHLELKLQKGENDFDTLLAILNIKPEDYEKEVIPDAENKD